MKDLQEVKNQLLAKEVEESINTRMQVVAEKFELSDSQEKAIASEIKNIGSDEDFKSYLERLSLFATPKGSKVDVVEKADQKAKASNPERVVSDAIKNGETKEDAVASSGTKEKSLTEKYRDSFKVSFKNNEITV